MSGACHSRRRQAIGSHHATGVRAAAVIAHIAPHRRPQSAPAIRPLTPGVRAFTRRDLVASERAPHHGPRRTGTRDLDEASTKEERLRPGAEGRGTHPVGTKARHIDGMTFDGCGTVLPSELDGTLEKGGGDSGPAIRAGDCEAGHPPRRRPFPLQYSRQGPVLDDSGKPGSRSDPGPPGGLVIDVRGEPRRSRGLRDLGIERRTVVTRSRLARG